MMYSSLLQAEAKEIERADAVKAAEAVSFGVNIARYCKIYLITYIAHDSMIQSGILLHVSLVYCKIL